MNNRKLKIGIDLDEVLWDLMTPWLEAYNYKMSYWNSNHVEISPKDIKTWDMREYVGNNANILFNILTEEAFWSNVELKTGVYNNFNELNNKYDIYIITSSNYHSLTAKIGRLLELLPILNPSQIIVTNNKHMIDVDVMIDDKPENLINGKYKQCLMDAPHNHWLDTKSCGIERVYDWDDIANTLERYNDEIQKG